MARKKLIRATRNRSPTVYSSGEAPATLTLSEEHQRHIERFLERSGTRASNPDERRRVDWDKIVDDPPKDENGVIHWGKIVADMPVVSEEHQRQIHRFLKDDLPIQTPEEQRRSFAYTLHRRWMWRLHKRQQ